MSSGAVIHQPSVGRFTKSGVLKALGRALLYVIVWLGALTMLVPFFWMVSTSLKPLADVFAWPPNWIPRDPLWGNYREIFEFVPLARYLGNTLFVAVVRTIGVLIASTMAGYAFAQLRFPGRDIVFLGFLGTLMIPDEVTLIPSFVIMRELGWINTYYALIVPKLFSPFGVFLMRQFFLTIPRDLSEAAFVDGASPLRIYCDIILPLAKPAIATLAVFNFLASWNDFLWPLVVTTSDDLRMISVGLANFQDLYYTEWSLLMAASVVALMPVLLLYFFAQRYFVEGITVTGIKG